LPDTSKRFALMQINDAYGRGNISMTTAQIQAEAPHYDSIWGSFQPGTWDTYHPGMLVSRYVLPNEDVKLISKHDLTWWKANHPDWILYACLSNGTPTHDLAASGTGFGDIPLDIHNTSALNSPVVDYQVRQLVGPDMIREGFNAIAADNITFANYLFDASLPLSSHAYGCGVWQGNTFVRRYGPPTGGDFDKPDPAFISDLINWLAQAKKILTTDTTLAPHHFKIIVNHPFDSSSPDGNELSMLQSIDGLLDESGFTHYGSRVTQGGFAQAVNWAQYAQSHNRAIFFADYFCQNNTNPDTGQPCSTDPSTLTAKEVDWALGSYAIVNNGGSNVFISPKGGAIYTYRPEYAKQYGAACGAFTQSGYLYTRRFANGFAVVNAGTTAQMVQLPAHTYSDIEGRPISSRMTVNAADAYMLLLTPANGTGCT